MLVHRISHFGVNAYLVAPFVGFATWHKPTALASARALRALDPTRLAAGHGAVAEAPATAMDRAIAAAA